MGRTFSCNHWKAMNSAGTTNSKASVPTSIPPTAPEPNVRLPLAPTPVDTISGSSPNTIVRAVIRMGRNRTLAAPTAACISDMPACRRLTAYSVIRMAVFASNPMSIIKPVCI